MPGRMEMSSSQAQWKSLSQKVEYEGYTVAGLWLDYLVGDGWYRQTGSLEGMGQIALHG
jgi:hypothetical protein